MGGGPEGVELEEEKEEEGRVDEEGWGLPQTLE